MTAWSNELQSLDPETDYERIVYLLSVYEFSWDIEKAFEFALFRTMRCHLFPAFCLAQARSAKIRANAMTTQN
jgi:hypothetical protein